jgi:hypothetical protein
MDQGNDKKGIVKAMVLALVITFAAIAVLGWQYRKIESQQIPALEEKLEKRIAENALDKFMAQRIQKNESGAMLSLTERAADQKDKEEFVLIDDFENYEILSSQKLTEGQFRFIVKIYENNGLYDITEIIILLKVGDKYYIDSVEMAG